MNSPSAFHAIGLMSGTAMDGVDAVLMRFEGASGMQRLAHAHVPMPAPLRAELLALNASGHDELRRAAEASIGLTRLYAQAVQAVRAQAPESLPIHALGAHGQTVRHHPHAISEQLPHGYTLQLNQPALLTELCGITVVADFRSRDVAAGGQGAPLVPAFHQAWLGQSELNTVVLNWGGIANISVLPSSGVVTGFDTGPANALLDGWCEMHTAQAYDLDGAWGAQGTVHAGLLAQLLAHPFFDRTPPKSTGRDDFHMPWLQQCLQHVNAALSPQDVQATLAELTATSTAQAILAHAPNTQRLVMCGGGARNLDVVRRLQRHLPQVQLSPASAHGLASDEVEAAAFAWLAWRCLSGQPGNLPSVTRAQGPRVLGAIYPV